LDLKQGKHIRGYEIRIGFEFNVVMGSDIVEMECNHCWLG
jgi:hypothetical protein